MSHEFYDSLSFRTAFRPTDPALVIASDGIVLDLLGRILLRFSLCGQQVVHELGIVKSLTVPFILGGEFLQANECVLSYSDRENERSR